MMKSGKVAAAVKSDPEIFGGLMNAQSASGSGRPRGQVATGPAGDSKAAQAAG